VTAVANLPAEITHLYEEVQAKDVLIQESRSIIAARDSSLQKFIKLNGSLVQNPKEEPYSKIITQHFERAQVLQEEKIALVDKASALVRFCGANHDCVFMYMLTRRRWTDM
jgi:inhibitor of growth protein 3